MYIENDGHSAIITIEPNDALHIPNVIQGNLPGTYQLGQIRFRWGDDGESGSEHYLFGVSISYLFSIAKIIAKYYSEKMQK